MKQKYQNTLIFIGISLLLLLLPLLLTAQQSIPAQGWTDKEVKHRVERATLLELFESNPNSRFSKEWTQLTLSRNCDLCSLKEVTCNEEGFMIALDLTDMGLQILPASIHNLAFLQRLHLHGNDLENLPATLGNMTQLESLSIFNNNINTLPSRLRNLCGISIAQGLEGNPIHRLMTWEEFCRGI